MQGDEVRPADEAQQQVLLDGRAHLALRAELFRDVGERAELRHAQVPEREADGRRDQLGVALRAYVAARELLESGPRGTPARVRERRPRSGGRERDRPRLQRLALLVILPEKLLRPDLLDHELEAGAMPVLPVAGPVEHPHHRFADVDRLFRRSELVRDDPGPAQRRESAGDGDPEARLAVAHAGEETDVVEGSADAVVPAASAEGDLELAGQRRGERPAQQVPRHRLGIGRAVERFQRRGAGIGTGGHVADGVAARLAGGESGIGEHSQRIVGFRQVHEVELHVLPRGDVPAADGVPLRDVSQRAQLRRREDALGDLDAHHHRVAFLPLAVDAVHQAELLPRIGGDLAALELAQHGDERVQILLVGEAEAGGTERLAIEQRHVDLLRGRPGAGWRERRSLR